MSNVMTPPGESMLQGQQQMQHSLSVEDMQMLKALFPLMQRQIEFNKSMQASQNAALQTGLAGTGESARQSRIAREGATVDANAAKAQRQSALAAREQGLGDGSGFGNFAQDAAKQKNAYVADQYSPENYLGDALSQGQMFGASNAAQGGNNQLWSMLAGLVNGQPPVQTGPGFGDALGGILGGWASSGFKTGK